MAKFGFESGSSLSGSGPGWQFWYTGLGYNPDILILGSDWVEPGKIRVSGLRVPNPDIYYNFFSLDVTSSNLQISNHQNLETIAKWMLREDCWVFRFLVALVLSSASKRALSKSCCGASAVSSDKKPARVAESSCQKPAKVTKNEDQPWWAHSSLSSFQYKDFSKSFEWMKEKFEKKENSCSGFNEKRIWRRKKEKLEKKETVVVG